ncbi:hypothetical protein QAD02_023763 [Eretmocerus hayati]|uniref:Uncharacterized protein n=1 Tax=Eretmocerus hayati TaxID=131215 RepID=A0ACC2PWV7_9HYME|nr:hypothetical protein QAD02_023763 [Eretmocerus hayati]
MKPIGQIILGVVFLTLSSILQVEAEHCKYIRLDRTVTISKCKKNDQYTITVTCFPEQPLPSKIPENKRIKGENLHDADLTFQWCSYPKKLNIREFLLSLNVNQTRNLAFQDSKTVPSSEQLENLEVENLELKRINSNELPYDLLYHMNLKYLRINWMALTRLPENFFEKSSNLHLLEIRNTNLSQISSADFAGLSGLNRLHLISNKVSRIEAGSFDHTSDLTFLSIYDEPLESLPTGVFDKLSKLETLEIYKSKLTSLPSSLLRVQGKSLVELFLNKNDELDTIPSDLLKGLVYLKNIQLVRNKLTSLDENMFVGLDALGYVDVSHNKLKIIPENIFKGNKNLQVFLASGNLLEHFSGKIFLNTGLKLLYLDANNISSLPADFALLLGNNTEIHLETNRIAAIDFSALEKYAVSVQGNTEINYLSLDGNPLICDCQLLGYQYHKMKEDMYRIVAISFGDHICKAPTEVENRNLKEISMKDLRC